MDWNMLYTNGDAPSLKQIAEYIDNPLWAEFDSRIRSAYRIEPYMDYSRCSMQPGWNIKYKKSGKSLCTCYPMQGYFIALVVIGSRELTEAELLMPFLFGEETLAGCGDFSPLRDSSELLLLSQVYERKKPVLGICRGAQLINIALGGDIYQDIFSQLSGRIPIAHRQPFNATHPAHRVAVEAGSRLAQISESLSLEVNSLHHQAIRNVAPCLTVCGRASDGIIEAVEQPGHPFLLGVQWHPEQLAGKYSHADRLFSAFIKACRKA